MTGSKSFRKKTLKVIAKAVLTVVSVVLMLNCICSAAGFCYGIIEGTGFIVPIFLRCVLFAALSFLSSLAAIQI